MIKIKTNKKLRSYVRAVGGLLILLIINACVFFDGFSGPDSAIAGEEISFTVNMRVEPRSLNEIAIENTRIIASFLVPNSWNPRETVTMTYTTTVDDGEQPMSLIPQDISPKNKPEPNWELAMREEYGVGPNVLNDMKWVTFQSDRLYTLRNNEDVDAVITINAIVGPKNLRFKPGFFVNHSNDGIGAANQRGDGYYDECFEVTEGEGQIIDYCELHFNKAQPLTATKDDFLTFSFVGSVAENELIEAQEVHFCATAYTTEGTPYTVCGMDDKTLMKRESELSDTFNILINPASYFGIPDGAQIDYIDYTFKNNDGSIEIDDNGNSFIYVFECD